jgi:hypothetical protein
MRFEQFWKVEVEGFGDVRGFIDPEFGHVINVYRILGSIPRI